jgi:hypothetical protein
MKRFWNFVFRTLLLLVSIFYFLVSAVGQTAYPASLGFPAGIIGTAESGTLTTTFTNTSSVTISSMSVSVTTNSAAYSVSTSPTTNCGGSMTSGATCTLTVTYTPQVTGLNAGTITISWSGTAYSPFYVYLAGYGFQGGSSMISGPICNYQGTTAVSITTTSFTSLGYNGCVIAGGAANYLGKTIYVEGSGVYTNGAASVLNIEVSFCTVSGCGSGTVLSPAGFVATSTSQSNTLTNGQFNFDGYITISATGNASNGAGMAEIQGCFNLGSTTGAVVSCFQDTATAVSSTFDLTVNEYLTPQFKFSTSNAGNSATLQQFSAQFMN